MRPGGSQAVEAQVSAWFSLTIALPVDGGIALPIDGSMTSGP